MSAPAQSVPSGFSVGSVLGRSFPIWLKNIVPFFILGLIVYLPVIIYLAVLIVGEAWESESETALTVHLGIAALVGNLLNLVVTAAIIYGVFQQLRGRRPGMGDCIAVGLKRLFPVLGVGILVGIITVAGMFLLIIPGIVFLCMLWVSVPVAVVERPGVFASLKRSHELTKGSKLAIFGILFVLFALNYLANLIITAGVSPQAAPIAQQAVGIALGVLFAVTNAVSYHDLRALKEGVGIEELVAVFE